jgi:hypothetical protein
LKQISCDISATLASLARIPKDRLESALGTGAATVPIRVAGLACFRAKWTPVRVQKTRQIQIESPVLISSEQGSRRSVARKQRRAGVEAGGTQENGPAAACAAGPFRDQQRDCFANSGLVVLGETVFPDDELFD